MRISCASIDGRIVGPRSKRFGRLQFWRREETRQPVDSAEKDGEPVSTGANLPVIGHIVEEDGCATSAGDDFAAGSVCDFADDVGRAGEIHRALVHEPAANDQRAVAGDECTGAVGKILSEFQFAAEQLNLAGVGVVSAGEPQGSAGLREKFAGGGVGKRSADLPVAGHEALVYYAKRGIHGHVVVVDAVVLDGTTARTWLRTSAEH